MLILTPLSGGMDADTFELAVTEEEVNSAKTGVTSWKGTRSSA